MINTNSAARRVLGGGTALSVLAALGSGLVLSAAVSTPAFAQDYTNVTANGRVTDGAGKGIPGASVTVTSNAQGFSNTVTTDSSGTYRVPALPQGMYTFEVSAAGFQPFADKAVNLTQGSSGNEFQLVSGTASTDAGGEVVVVGRRVKVSDFDRTTTGAVISIGELASRVPVARDLTSVILLAPGTAVGDSAFGNLAAVSGSSVSENAFFLNGLNITEFREGLGAVNVPFEFYNTVEVKNGGIPAEFGRFTGGFINATTKSGSNEFHGGLLFNFEPDSLREDAPNSIGGTLRRTGYNKQDYEQTQQAIVNLSGPIIKDRLFFYAFYQANNTRSGDTLLTSNPTTCQTTDPATGACTAYFAPYSTGLRREERDTKSPFFGGKLDAIITDGHRLEFTYFDSRQKTTIDDYRVLGANGATYDSRNGGAPLIGPNTGTRVLRLGGQNYVGRYTGQFTDWITLSGAYGKNKNRDIAGSGNDAYPFIADVSGNFPQALTGNSLNVIDDNSDTREFYRGDIDLYFSLLGQHHIKGGYDREKLKTNSASIYTGGVAWTYANSGATGDAFLTTPNTLYVSGRTFVNGGTFKSDNEAFYVQDAWSLFDNRLTLNLGVRNDKFKNYNVDGVLYYKSGSSWAPRLSFSGDPFGDAKTKIYGSYGKYYLPIVANTNIRLAGAELDYDRYYLVNGVNPDNTPILGAPILFPGGSACPMVQDSIANCDVRSDGVATPTEATVAKNLKPQSVDEYVLGVERQLGNGIRVGVFGQYRKLNESLEDVAIDGAVQRYCEQEGIEGCADIWSAFHQYVLVNPGAASTITLSDPLPGETEARTVDFSADMLGYPKAKRTYKAITATFDRDFDGKWSLSGSYTYSKSKGNVEGGIRSDNGQTDSGLTTAFDQPGLTDGTYGYLPGDNRHKFKIYGSYAPTDWITVGLQFQAQSPRRYGCIGKVPNAVDPLAGAYGAAGFYCLTGSGGEVVTDPGAGTVDTPGAGTQGGLTPRGSVFKSDWQTFTNLSVAFRLPAEAFNATLRMDVFNVFNEKAKLDFEERGTTGAGRPRGDYGYPTIYQTPRYFRFQLGFDF